MSFGLSTCFHGPSGPEGAVATEAHKSRVFFRVEQVLSAMRRPGEQHFLDVRRFVVS